MKNTTFGKEYLKELEGEITSSRKCLERIPEHLFGWKPHERSMTMGYLALLVAEIPLWITNIIEKGEINFQHFKHKEVKNAEDLVNHFDENIKGTRAALEKVSDDALADLFYLKNGDQVLLSSPKKDNVMQAINHLVHHRGQLTIYMRLNDIAVPSIYGPSADDRTF